MAVGARPDVFAKKSKRSSVPIKAGNISDLKFLAKGSK